MAKEKVELIAPARLYGDVETPRLIVTEGVIFDGNCSMGVAKQKGGVTGSQNLSAEKAVVAKTAKLQADFRNKLRFAVQSHLCILRSYYYKPA